MRVMRSMRICSGCVRGLIRRGRYAESVCGEEGGGGWGEDLIV